MTTDPTSLTDEELSLRAHHTLDVKHLAALCNPFSAWGDIERPILKKEIRACLKAGEEALCETPLWTSRLGHATSDGHPMASDEIRQNHIRKIAYFARHTATTPIELDVGIPSMNCHVEHLVQDGNHRLAGALIRGDATIAARVGGSVEHAQSLGLWGPNAFEREVWARFEAAQIKPRRKPGVA